MESDVPQKGSEGRRRFPFKIDRRVAGSVEVQFTDALRAAIVTGRYKPGDVLPSIVEFSRGLGVSIRAPQAALKALAKEGLVSPRRRTGTIVSAPRDAAFRGNVLLVSANTHPVYYDTLVESRVSEALLKAGFLVTRIVAPLKGRSAGGDFSRQRYDLRQLRFALRQSVALAVIIDARRQVIDAVSQSGTPFAVIGVGSPVEAPECVAFGSCGLESAVPAVVARLRPLGIRRLAQFSIRRADLLDGDALHGVCGTLESTVVWPTRIREPFGEDFVRAGMKAVRERLSRSGDSPDGYIFTDDYLARGALTALLAAGVKTGRAPFFMTLANKGISPVHPDPIDLLLRDPAKDAETVAAAVLDFLDKGTRRNLVQLPVRLVRGS